MNDPFNDVPQSVNSPAVHAAAVSPSDTVALTTTPRSLYVGTGGNLSLLLAGDTVPVLFSNVAAGSILPVRPVQVMATGTTAGAIVAIW